MPVIRLFSLMVRKGNKLRVPDRAGRSQSRLFLSALLVLMASMSGAATATQPADGKALVMERSKGNCLACHVIADGELPGNIGPPLVGMKARFPDAEILREQIWDASKRNPDSRMPPFGRHRILSHEEIDLIVKYLYTL